MKSSKRGWRPDDEALLSRLEDEDLLEQAWFALAGVNGRPPHARAAGTIAALRELPDGPAAISRAASGDLAPLLRAITQPDPKALTAPLAHHLALFHWQLADALERAHDPTERAGAEKARVRSIAMWLWLAEESTYLRRTADAVVAGGLSETETARAAAEAPYEVIHRLGERAHAGARELAEPARLALRALAKIGDAIAMSGAGEKVQKHAERRAMRERNAAVDGAIAPVDHALEEASARASTTDELVALFASGTAIWRWADRDPQVEHFLVERITPFCWERYRERRWGELRALLVPIQEPVEHLAKRIARDPTKLAYAAPCAQMIVFRAEVSQTFEAQLALAERAVALCPTHRNGRLVLADLLIERGMRALDVAMPWATGDAIAKAAEDVRRAATLFPSLKRVDEAKQRLKAMGRDLDAA